MCRNLFTNRLATLWKNTLQYSCFLMNFAKCLRTPFLENTSGQLLLSIAIICLEHLKLNVRRMTATIF